MPPSMMSNYPKYDNTNIYQQQQQLSQKTIDYKLPVVNGYEGNGKYSLNMKIKDLSYRVPWATENQEKLAFRTTSNAYGNTGRY